MPETGTFAILTFGFILGVKHALDVDHVTAVSTMLSKSRSIFKASRTGILWGIGHTVTLLLAGILVLGFKFNISERLALSMELLVGVVLVLLGVPIIRTYVNKRLHFHTHRHGNKVHFHVHSHDEIKDHQHSHGFKSLFVGMVHGMAGSAALMLAVLTTTGSLLEGISYIFIFSLGSILGMLIFSGILGIPFILAEKHHSRVSEAIKLTAGLISVGLGTMIIWEIGVTQGLLFG
jgi:sulfite exporter TauE/SafE